MFPAKDGHFLGQGSHAVRLTGSYGNLPGELLLPLKLLLGLICQIDDLLGASAQKDSVVGQDNAVLAPMKQLDAQLLLQLHQLTG